MWALLARLSAQAYLLGGAQMSGSYVDLYQLQGNIDQVHFYILLPVLF